MYTAMQGIHGRLAVPLPSSKEILSPGKVMLIWSAATAVGHSAIQLATNAGIKGKPLFVPREAGQYLLLA